MTILIGTYVLVRAVILHPLPSSEANLFMAIGDNCVGANVFITLERIGC